MRGRHAPQAFVERDAHGRGQVQAADGPGNGDVKEGLWKSGPQVGRQAAGLRAENQIKARTRRHGPERVRTGFGEQADLLRLRARSGQEFMDVIPDGQPYLGPVVQAGPFEVPILEGEAQRPDEVERGAGPEAGAADVARVPVNLRAHQDHVAFEGRAVFML